ncbi:hypothetical protein [Methanomethylovorans sp.]|uniref:hypothetical protein n=1 Tax=Methanomethylovorans sp. TaxID=2758717 RepID=UPI00345E372B
MKQIRLLCDTNTMCYGSSSALLAIVSNIPGRKTALAWEITKEILETDPSIDEIIEVNVKDSLAVSKNVELDMYDAVLVISNLSNLETYLQAGIPVFFVDILYWYQTPKDHPVWEYATQCFIEDFPGVDKMIKHNSSGNSLVVGPLIRDRICVEIPDSHDTVDDFLGTLVNLGGGKSRWVTPGMNTQYAQLVLELINEIRSSLPKGAILIAGGREAIEQLRTISKYDGIEFQSLPQKDFLKCLAGCKLYITSPGLNAVMEGLEFDKPMVFLPPQNASQVLQLEIYEKAGIVNPGMNLTAHISRFKSLEKNFLDEKKLTDEVLSALDVVMSSSSIKRSFASVIEYQIKNLGTPSHHKAVSDFKAGLWPPGSKYVAEFINSWWKNEAKKY